MWLLSSLSAGVGALGLPEDHVLMRAAAFIAAALAALGYGVARAMVKKGG